MVRFLKGFMTAALLALLMLPVCQVAHAYTVRSGGYMLPGGQVLEDDLVFLGGRLDIRGHITGDVLCIGSVLDLSGRVDGDITGAMETVDISGECSGDVRLAGVESRIPGTVRGGLTLFSGKVDLFPPSVVGKNLHVLCQDIRVGGTVAGDIHGICDNVHLMGSIGRDANLDIRSLDLLPGTRIGGNLSYKGPERAMIAEGAVISGGVDWKPKNRIQDSPLWKRATKLGHFLKLSLHLVLGWVLILLLPGPFRRATTVDAESLGRKTLAGGAFLVLTPFIAAGLMVTLVGLPAGVFILAAYGMTLVIANCAAGLLVGRLLCDALGWKPHDLLKFTLGAFLITAVTSINLLAIPLYLIILCVGAGILVTSIRRSA